jgi:high-affinity iron transporter
MIPTFVITLREGVEASLIVGIIAAFLSTRGRGLGPMWVGVASAITLCFTAAVAFSLVGSTLSTTAREAAEGALALVAVAGVTYMIVWMQRHARELKGHLEARAAVAIGAGSATALVLMAFFAVLREGVETAVFLLAAFEQTRQPLAAGVGALLGVLAAVTLGYAIYAGGVRIDLARFFRVTGLVLVFVAGGLLAGAVHAFTEAGVLAVGTHPAIDISWLVAPGSVRASLLTGMFGLQPVPTYAELFVWLAYVVPMTLFIWRPVRRPVVPDRVGSSVT